MSLAMNGFWKKRTVPETSLCAGVDPDGANAAMVAVAIWKTPKLMRYLWGKLVLILFSKFPPCSCLVNVGISTALHASIGHVVVVGLGRNGSSKEKK